jgi:segregation and condensation protein B
VTITPQELRSAIEAIIYVADEPATLEQIARALELDKSEIRAALDELVASYAAEDRGIEIRKVAGGWRFYTKAQHHDVVRKFIKSLRPPLRLTMPALETLAVIAYKQPVTGPEISEIRGVNTSGVVKTLLEKHLVSTAGRKEVIGRPIMYRTSKEFLMRFGLSDVDDLPSLKEFEQLAKAALSADEGIAPIEPEDAAHAESDGSAQRAPEASTADSTAGEPGVAPELEAVADAPAEIQDQPPLVPLYGAPDEEISRVEGSDAAADADSEKFFAVTASAAAPTHQQHSSSSESQASSTETPAQAPQSDEEPQEIEEGSRAQ